MTSTRVAALVMIPLAIVVGTVGGHFWHVTHPPQVATLADHPVGAAPEHTTPPPAASPAPAPVTPAPTPAKPQPEVAARETAPAVATLPQADTPPAKAPAPAADEKTPSFDIVRVEPQGDAVVAGKGAPNAKVALLSGGKVVGEANSDAAGQFVILPQRLAPGDHALTLRQTPDGQPASDSTQSVAVSVPQPGKGKALVALAEPGKATKLLSPPPDATSAAPMPAAPAGKVVIRSAELENGSGVYVSGAASPGTSVHIYLNDSHLADVTAGADGTWSVRVKHGLTGGHYTVRADATGSDGKVASRAEVPFDVPVAMAEAENPVVAPPAPAVVASATTKTAPSAPAPAQTPSAAAPSESPAAAPPSETAAAPEPPTGVTPESPAAAAPAAPEPATASAEAPKSSGADAVIETIATARVIKGDNLWNISRFRLGEGMRYTQIYAANSDQIRDPNLIYPGQVFVVPNR